MLGTKIVAAATRIAITVLSPVEKITFVIRRLGYRAIWARYNLTHASSSSDVFIVSFPGSGATWLQMIVYQLNCSGEMDIPHINKVQPFLDSNITIPKPQMPSGRRVFKSHAQYCDIPKGDGRYIYLARGGLDVAVSLYYRFLNGSVTHASFEVFFKRFFSDLRMLNMLYVGGWFGHVAGWVRNKRNLKMLFLRYEDLIEDLPRCIRRVADFCGIEIRPEDWPRILHNCSFEFMRASEEKFRPYEAPNQQAASVDEHFIRRGKTGGWLDHIDDAMLNAFQREGSRWSHISILREYCDAQAKLIEQRKVLVPAGQTSSISE